MMKTIVLLVLLSCGFEVKAEKNKFLDNLIKEVQNDKNALQVDFKIKEIKSKLGIPIWIVSNKSPVVVINAVWDDGGEITEKQPGSKVVFAEMANRGPKGLSYKEYTKKQDTFELSAGYIVRQDNLYFSVLVLKDFLKDAIDLCTQVIHNPRLDHNDFEEIVNKRARSLSETDHPQDLVANDLWKYFYKGHAYGRVLSPTDFRSLRYEHILDVHKDIHTLENLKVVVCGDISEEEAIDAVDKLFADLPKESIKADEKYIEIPKKSEVRVLSYPTPHVSGVFIHNSYVKDQDVRKLLMQGLLINALGGAGVLGSRLSKNIREKHGWVYSINCYFKDNKYSKLIVGKFNCSPENTNKVIKAVYEEYKKMHENGLTQEELDDMKAYFYGNVASSITSNNDIANLMLQIMLKKESIDYFNNVYKMVDSITLEEINKAAKELIKPGELIFSVLGNIADAKLNSDEANKLMF